MTTNPATNPAIGLCWGTVEKASLDQMIDLAGRHGFGALQVRPGLYLDARKAGRTDAELRAALKRNNVRVEVIDTFGPRLPGIKLPDKIAERDRAGLQMSEDEGFALAEALEARVINLPHYMGRPDTPLPQIIDAFGSFCERARRRGFKVSFEFIPGTGVSNLATGLKVVRGIGNAGVLFDTWHMSRSNSTLREVLDLKPGDVTAIQISDRSREHMHTTKPYVPMTGRLQPGDGDLPLAEIVRHLLKTHPGMNVAVEVFSDEQRAYSPDEAARVSAAAMSRLFSRL